MPVEIVVALISAGAAVAAAVIGRDRLRSARPDGHPGRNVRPVVLFCVAGVGVGLALVSLGVLAFADMRGPVEDLPATAPMSGTASRTPPTPTPSRTGTPTSTSPPATGPPITVTVGISIDPRQNQLCPASFTFMATVTVTYDKPVTLRYQWLRGGSVDHRFTATESLTFSGSVKKQVVQLREDFSFTSQRNGQFWAEFQIVEPVKLDSNRATATRSCPATDSKATPRT